MPQKNYNKGWSRAQKVWDQVQPPWRPHIKDLKFWEQKIIELKDTNAQLKALVLGSTPEIRDLLCMHKIDVTLLDINKPMYKAMSRLTKLKNKNERIVWGNWLDADKIFSHNIFDFIIGDMPHCNLTFKIWPRFFEAIYNILKPESYFFLAAVVIEFTDRLTIQKFINKYKKNPKYFQNFKNRIYAVYQLIDEIGVYNKNLKGYIFKNMRNLLKKEGLRNGLTLREIDQKLWFIKDDLDGQGFGKDYIEVDPTLEEHLIIQSDFFYLDKILKIANHPVFNLRRSFILKSKKTK